MFDIPIVLFIFKRLKAVQIIQEISKIKPQKLYIIADGARNRDEIKQVEECRRQVEHSINWECEVVKNYSQANRGVYQNIGEGAKWVFSRESMAIFLEDDNLPESTFFEYCRDLLLKYKDEEKILWICGTNYLEDYRSETGESYYFTKHMLPCGWASWDYKFLKYYDGNLCGLKNKINKKQFKRQYLPHKLYYTMKDCWMREYDRMVHNDKPISWDYQMDFSIKYHNLYGICPAKNQIKNIGVDADSIHGGVSKKAVMTSRFCERNTYKLNFPLIEPEAIMVNPDFERRLGKIILPPLNERIVFAISKFIRKILHIPYNITTKEYLKNVRKKKK